MAQVVDVGRDLSSELAAWLPYISLSKQVTSSVWAFGVKCLVCLYKSWVVYKSDIRNNPEEDNGKLLDTVTKKTMKLQELSLARITGKWKF